MDLVRQPRGPFSSSSSLPGGENRKKNTLLNRRVRRVSREAPGGRRRRLRTGPCFQCFVFPSPSSLPPQTPPSSPQNRAFPLPPSLLLSPRQLRLHLPRLLLLPRPRRNPPRQHAQHQEGAQPHEDEPLGPPGRSRVRAPQPAHAVVVFCLVFLVAAACSSSFYPTTSLVRGGRIRRIPARPRQHTAVGARARRLDELPRGGEVELRRVGARHMGLLVLCCAAQVSVPEMSRDHGEMVGGVENGTYRYKCRGGSYPSI